MLQKTNTLALTLSAVIAATALSQSAFATEQAAAKNTNTDQSKTASAAKSQAPVYVVDSIKIPGHAKSVLSDIRGARFALFDGQTKAAMDLVQKARTTFDRDVWKYAIKLEGNRGYGIPVDNSIDFAENFKPSPQHAKVIKAAGALAQQGKATQAVKSMVDAGMALSFKYALLPVGSALKSLEKAKSDMKANNFYEANMALKSIEASVLVTEFDASETPQQGYAWEVINNS